MEREDSDAIRLLKHILFEDGNPEDRLSNISPVRDAIAQDVRLDPVEPELIGVMANARSRGLILWLVSRDNLSGTRSRRLNDPEFARMVDKKIPWIEIEWAGETTVEIPHRSPPYSASSGSRDQFEAIRRAKESEFEPKVALWLQDRDSDLRCITPPPTGDLGGEEIDLYGYRNSSAETIVVVGECKLRREGNEAKAVDSEEVKQLVRKLVAARDYESRRRRKSGGTSKPLRYEGLLMSNAHNVDESAHQLLEDNCDFSLRVLEMTLSKNWDSDQHWRIVSGRQVFPDQS